MLPSKEFHRMKARITRTAVILGVIVAVFGFAGVFLIVNYLPGPFGVLIPIAFLAVPIVALWPSRFDASPTAGWPRRFGHRMAAVLAGAVIAGVLSAVIGLAVPQFAEWGDNQHRAALRKRAVAEAEIEARIAAHPHSSMHDLRDGAFSGAVPGTLAALVTTVAGAVMFRRRRTP
jgi:hypothetical protein